MWIAIIAALVPLLKMLFDWLNTKTSLTTAQQSKLNQLIFRFNEIRGRACAMGCVAEGTPATFEATANDVDDFVLASELIDKAFADAGHHAAGGADVAVMKSKLSELITKLRALGLTWDKIFGLVNIIVPMIVSGQFDWAALWAWVQTLLPTPNPGPMSP